MARRRFKVYLAGPIGGCNEAQRRSWREQVKKHWAADFEFIDPAEKPVPQERRSHEVIEEDMRSIEAADGVLANMWRESIGTAIGIAHASARGRPVVVVDPNHLQSRILAFYAAAVVERPDDGMRVLRDLLRSERSLTVIRYGGDEEPFERGKLLAALRGACRAAKRSDVAVPPMVLRHVLERLGKEPRGLNGRITTKRIEEIVLEVLRGLEGDPPFAESLTGVAEAWRRFIEGRGRGGKGVLPPPPPAGLAAGSPPPPLRVRVRSGKSHASIWGKTVKSLGDVPAPARGVFERMITVPGIEEIRLTTMRRGTVAEDHVCVDLVPSTTPHLIEGKLHDPSGRKGTVQAFQVRVHDEARRDHIGAEVQRVLERAGLWRR